MQRDCHTPFTKGSGAAVVVRPRSQPSTILRQGSTRPVDLTLAGMTVLEPRDAGVTDSASDLADECRDSVLGRSHRALSVGIVSVVLLIAFEATAVGTPIDGLGHPQ